MGTSSIKEVARHDRGREQLGRTAAGLLFDEINEGDQHRHRQALFEPELVVRESSSSGA